MSNKAAKKQIANAEQRYGQVESQIKNFKRQDLVNAFGDTKDFTAGLTNQFANQRVATGAAEFQAQRQDQGQADILDAIRQGGGNSASSATALARQGAESNQNIAAGLQQQETANQRAAAQGAAGLDRFKAAGASNAQQLRNQGQQYTQDLYETRENQALAGLGQQLNVQQSAINSGTESIAKTNAAWIGAAGDIASAAVPFLSDPRTKEDIDLVGKSPSGIPVYEWKYKGKEGRYRGAMSNEVPREAVVENFNNTGFDAVDYSLIDINMIKLN